MTQNPAQQAVVHICERGCRYVREVIELLASGQGVTETQGLSAQDCAEVLVELRSIMAVYDARHE